MKSLGLGLEKSLLYASGTAHSSYSLDLFSSIDITYDISRRRWRLGTVPGQPAKVRRLSWSATVPGRQWRHEIGRVSLASREWGLWAMVVVYHRRNGLQRSLKVTGYETCFNRSFSNSALHSWSCSPRYAVFWDRMLARRLQGELLVQCSQWFNFSILLCINCRTTSVFWVGLLFFFPLNLFLELVQRHWDHVSYWITVNAASRPRQYISLSCLVRQLCG